MDHGIVCRVPDYSKMPGMVFEKILLFDLKFSNQALPGSISKDGG